MKTFPIYHLIFPSQHLVASTFLRFQEHYEGPGHRRKVFDLEEYMDWYARENGAFTYCTDWTGFNIPSRVLVPFREGRFDPLTRKEQALLGQLADIKGDFYVIGTYKDDVDPTVLAHEATHGLFGAKPDYAKDVLATLSGFNLKKFRKAIIDQGYHPEVLEDECNAYLTTGLSPFLKGKDVGEAAAARVRLLKVYKDHFNIDPSTSKGRKWLIERINKRTFILPAT